MFSIFQNFSSSIDFEQENDSTLDPAPDYSANKDSAETPPKKEKFIRRAFIFVVYVAIVLFVALSMPKILARVLGTPHPMAAITSQSMWPALKRGDLVFIKKIMPSEIKKGMIVVYRQGQSFIIHRVVKTGKNTVTTKGDGNTDTDPSIDRSEILGAVPTVKGRLLKIPFLGRISTFANKRG